MQRDLDTERVFPFHCIAFPLCFNGNALDGSL